MRPVCVIGLGLIGGSLLRAAVRAGRPAFGATKSAAGTQAAAADGYPVEAGIEAGLRRAAAEDALVVVGVPLTVLDPVLRLVAEHAPNCVLTDVTSVKGPVLDVVRRVVPTATFVGGHPMAGTAESGWAAGVADLFDGAAWVVAAEDDTDAGGWLDVAGLALDCGAHVVPIDAAAHDDAVARISHLPHLLAAILASVGEAGGPLALSLAAGSFTDGTRVAGTEPDLVAAMCEGNRFPLLTAVDDALGRFGATRGALASTGGLRATITDGHRGRAAFVAQRDAVRVPVSVDLAGPDWVAELRAVGAAGGRITSVDGTVATGLR